MNLHLPTLLTVCVAALATSAGVMTLFGRTQRTYRGFGWWVGAQWLLDAGLRCCSCSATARPELLPLANLLLLQWPIVVLAGMRRFCLRHASPCTASAGLAAAGAGLPRLARHLGGAGLAGRSRGGLRRRRLRAARCTAR